VFSEFIIQYNQVELSESCAKNCLQFLTENQKHVKVAIEDQGGEIKTSGCLVATTFWTKKVV